MNFCSTIARRAFSFNVNRQVPLHMSETVISNSYFKDLRSKNGEQLPPKWLSLSNTSINGPAFFDRG